MIAHVGLGKMSLQKSSAPSRDSSNQVTALKWDSLTQAQLLEYTSNTENTLSSVELNHEPLRFDNPLYTDPYHRSAIDRIIVYYLQNNGTKIMASTILAGIFNICQ
jgi:hypothetical protein